MSNAEPVQAPNPRPPWLRRGIVAAGVLAACGLGVVLGQWARPELALPVEPKPMTTVVHLPDDGPAPMTFGAGAFPMSDPQSNSPLEALAEALQIETTAPEAPAAPLAPQALQALEAPWIAEPPQAPTPPPAPPPMRRAPPERQQVAVAAPRPAPPAAPRSPCAEAAPGADRMVCEDAMLAAADRAMNRAYRRALEAGVPSWKLRRQQDRWLETRAAASRAGPGAMADLYQTRIADLQDQAAKGRPLPGGDPSP